MLKWRVGAEGITRAAAMRDGITEGDGNVSADPVTLMIGLAQEAFSKRHTRCKISVDGRH
jgi:hypothetical protein